jgi:hypothetical protein
VQRFPLAISLLTLIVCLGFIVQSFTHAQSPAAPTRWQYLIVDQDTSGVATNSTARLNAAGDQGWELVGSFSYEDRLSSNLIDYSVHEVFTFKRAIR